MNTFAKNIEIRQNVMDGMDRISNMPRCRVRRSAVQTIPNFTNTIISFDGVNIDTDGLFSPAAPTRCTIRTAGFYDIKAELVYDAGGAGVLRTIFFQQNGVVTALASANTPVIAFGYTMPVVSSTSLQLNAGDWIELWALHDAGGAYNVTLAEMKLCLIST